MSESQITKKALAGSIKQLMETIPLAKISIQEIVDNCGLNRQTFYYHFKDKFDLVNWIYYSEVIESIADSRHYDNWSDGILKILLHINKNRAFYINALNTPGQNAFDGYLFEVTHKLAMGVVNEVAEGMNVFDPDKNFIADFYTHAFVGLTVQWIKKGMHDPPEIIVDRLKDLVEGSVFRAVTRYANPQHGKKAQ